MKRTIRFASDIAAEREQIVRTKTYMRGVAPPSKICKRCKAQCGVANGPYEHLHHDEFCDACSSLGNVLDGFVAAVRSGKLVEV